MTKKEIIMFLEDYPPSTEIMVVTHKNHGDTIKRVIGARELLLHQDSPECGGQRVLALDPLPINPYSREEKAND